MRRCILAMPVTAMAVLAVVATGCGNGGSSETNARSPRTLQSGVQSRAAERQRAKARARKRAKARARARARKRARARARARARRLAEARARERELRRAQERERKRQQAASSDCEPGYSPCVPRYPPDLDCADLNGPYSVTGSDPHRLDRDGDGTGCE